MKQSGLLRKALKATLPVMAGYLVLGTGFGMVLKAKGYGVLWAAAMSVFIYAGSLQFVGVSLLTSGASFLTTAITSLLVNARHLFYGISMINRYQDAGKEKPYLIFALTDETYSLLSADSTALTLQGKERRKYDLLVSLLDQCYWVTGSVLGSLLGSVFSFNTEGIDFALTALFITLTVDQWRSGKHRTVTGLGFAMSVVCLLLLGPERFLIPAMAALLAAVLMIRRREEESADEP